MVIDVMLARGNKMYVFTFSLSIKESPRMTSRSSESKVKLGEEIISLHFSNEGGFNVSMTQVFSVQITQKINDKTRTVNLF